MIYPIEYFFQKNELCSLYIWDSEYILKSKMDILYKEIAGSFIS